MDILAMLIGTVGGTAIGMWLGFRWLDKAAAVKELQGALAMSDDALREARIALKESDLPDLPFLDDGIRNAIGTLKAKLDALQKDHAELEGKYGAMCINFDAALAEPTPEEIVLAANQVVSFVDLARIALTGFINARRGK